MDQDLKNKTLDKLTKAQNILVAAPQNSSFDAQAAALSIYLSCTKLGKNTSVFAKAPTVADASKLYGIDKIGKSASNSFVIVIDEAINTVDKVTYYLDKTKLKITVHPLGGSKGVSKDQISFEKAPIKPDFIFAVNFESIEQLKQEITQEQNIDPNTWVVLVTKNSPSQKYAQVAVSSPEAASISEITAQLLQELALPLNEDIAFNLYSGILSATNNFDLANTKPSTFQIASFLVKFGAAKASLVQKPADSIREIHKDGANIEPAGSDADTKTTVNRDFFKIPSAKIEEVEKEKAPVNRRGSETDWLKPPKIYKGTNSFDKEY